jgi:cellulose synthase (UDP-forming)
VTATAIEDQATAVKLLSKGYQTRYLNEPLSVGLAPESNAVLHDQRHRWCRGSLQILFLPFGPFGRGLRLRHRLLFLQTHWVLNGLSPLMYVVCPIIFLWFGWNPFPTPHPSEVFAIPLCLSVTLLVAMWWLGRRQFIPFFWQAFQLFMAFELVPQALCSLLKPFGAPLLRINPATAKGQAAVGRRLDVHTLVGLLALMLLIVTGLVRAGHDDRLGGQPLEMAALLLWTLYAMSLVTLAALMCLEPWYRRRAERFELADEPGSVVVRGQVVPVQIVNLSVTGARVRLSRPLVVPIDQPMYLHKRHVGLIPCTLAYRSSTDVALAFVASTHPKIREALVRDLYINPVVQNHQHAAFALWPVLKRLGRLLIARS